MMIIMNLLEFIVLFFVFFILGMALHWLEIAISGYYFAFRVSQFLGRKTFLCFQLFIHHRSLFVYFLILIGWLYDIPPFELGILCCSYIMVTKFLPLDQITSYVNHLLQNKKFTFQTQISSSFLLPPNSDASLDAIDLQLYQIHDRLLIDHQTQVAKPQTFLNTIVCPICHSLTIPSSINFLRVFCDSCGFLLTTR